MSPEEILALPPGALTQTQRESYFANGYLYLERLVDENRLAKLRAANTEMIDRSRSINLSNDVFVLSPGHSAEAPRLRRLNCACDHHPVFWEYASRSILPDVVADLVGPDVKFREGMINFKWSKGGEAVGWHQDIPFYPHTNLTPLITLLFLEDVTVDMGPLMVVPGSHKREIFEHYGPDGRWTGGIATDDLKRVALDKAKTLTGPAGSVVIIHGCTVHGSGPNTSARARPLLIIGYSSADAFCYTALGTVSKYTWQVVRGQPAKFSHHEAVKLRMPPDWSGGYQSIFEDQKGEKRTSMYGN